MINRKRTTRSVVAVLALSAAGFVSLMGEEEFVDKAMIPTKNDVPTVCYGMTWKPDGSRVKLGDTCTPVEGLQRSLAHISKEEAALKQCVTGEMTQGEYDVLVNFAYQYGVPTTCRSSMVRHTNAGNYTAACNAYTLYRMSGGYDCSTTINGKPNKRCWGVWTRNLERQKSCLAAGV